ncbi:MAG: PH domain-containing protein [Prochlorococcaceae cyanobacterium]
MASTVLLATVSGSAQRAWINHLIQAVVTASLISMALAWSSRAAARRRYRTKGTPQRPLLAYPLWTVGLGLGCIVLFSACTWFAGQAPAARGGPKAALVFLVFVLLGVALVVSCLAESFVVDAAGIERLRFGRCRAIPWGDIARVSFPWGGPGIRLESRRGVRFEVAEMVNGFGVLCDALLLHVADGFRVVPQASMEVLRGSSLE